ncbi:mandelate racemase/muconate lactonizing enzyme family protein [Paenibacillus sanguinis]|uniref:mandelate racemase/muconate lactonizing enzyme family protein n=1 Tax=Paenibacillus sanguinis TaxID=225906 RepID=UPI00037253B8|nr:dipeptide epimerase [Paenibacillus sanguinis]
MIIKEISAKKLSLELREPVRIAIGSLHYCETVLVKVETDEGIIGYGEGSGATFVTGESADTILHAVQLLKEQLVGCDPYAIDSIHSIMDRTLVHNGAAKAAIDIALYDIMSQYAKLPLYRFLGGVVNRMETDKTIGIADPSQMAQEALSLVEQGFRQIKVKAGLNPDDDMEAIRRIREAVGGAIRLKVDANQGWSVGDALRVIRDYAEHGVEAVEQPVPYWDVDGLSYIRSKSPLQIMADESCFTPQDAMNLIKKEAVDLINIKLMKCGGLYKALQINAIAEAAGLSCMLGCMVESRLGISAGAALVMSRQNFKYGDLDSFIHFAEHEAIRGGISFETPYMTLPEQPGLGVEVSF